MMIFVYFITIPLEICFEWNFSRDKEFQNFHTVCNVFFVIDILFKFKTAYYDFGLVVTDPSRIFYNYLKNDFLPNAISQISLIVIKKIIF